jgi:hypothetical protein
VEVRRKNRREDETQFSVNMPPPPNITGWSNGGSQWSHSFLKRCTATLWLIGCPVVTKMSSSFFLMFGQ